MPMRLTAHEVGAELLAIDKWVSFRGWGLVPGIRSARFEARTETVTGTRIAVVNDDGSTHTEEIIEWRPGERLQIRMSGFSKPLRPFASHFLETWLFTPVPAGTALVRRFDLFPRGFLGAIVLRVIAPMLRRAMERQLREMNLSGR